MSNEFKKFGNNIELGLGRLRGVTQGCNYSYNKIEVGTKFQINLKSWEVKLTWAWIAARGGAMSQLH